jgi:urease accessory protein
VGSLKPTSLPAAVGGLQAAHPTGVEIAHQRAFGRLHLGLRRRGDETALSVLRQQGCLKARFPMGEGDGWKSVVTLNTSGGIAGGDSLESVIEIAPGAQASLAAQAAERFYRALPGAAPARLRTNLSVGAGAAAEWLPQESLLFDRCALDRTTHINLATDSWFLGLEWLVFGRVAMGEHVRSLRLMDRLIVRREGALVLHDAIRLQGALDNTLSRPAVGARAVATLVYQGPDKLDELREALQSSPGAEGGASLWDGLMVARIVSDNPTALRRAVIAGLGALRGGRNLPKVWLC